MTIRTSLKYSCLACVLAGLAFTACTDKQAGGTNQQAGGEANASTAAQNRPAPNVNPDEEIARLEKQAEKSPGDDAVREPLAVAYVRRGNALRDAGDLKAALKDYRRAIIFDEDNLEAQKNIAELSLQVEGERTGEYGEPEPPPISPGITAEEDDPTPTPRPSPGDRRRP